MFNFMKLGLLFSPSPFGPYDPMILEMVREERLQRAAERYARELEEARKFAAQDQQDADAAEGDRKKAA